RRLGKGGAIDSALDRITPADVYALVDGDVGETAAESSALLEEVLSGRLDLAIGRLPQLEGGGFGVVKAFSRWAIRAVTGFDAQEPLSGQRAATREALEACRPLASGFGLETAMTIDAVRLGFRVGEVPVDMRHRPTGRTLAGFSHRARQGIDILRAVGPRFLRLR
ncbi:MAG TPA: glycosyltransferase family 2 protein, partial [Actinomycetota bacterium]|nr:glycosyltransferase family 2 protein [Actinomycetota bacterium]